VIPSGADLLVRCLEREGVEYVFGVPGWAQSVDPSVRLLMAGLIARVARRDGAARLPRQRQPLNPRFDVRAMATVTEMGPSAGTSVFDTPDPPGSS